MIISGRLFKFIICMIVNSVENYNEESSCDLF